MTLTQPALAVGLGVVVAVLLYAKTPLHRLTRDWISEDEVHDGLILLAAALVVLPLVPDRAWGPYGAINPALLWRLVVLVMAISAAGHVALRLVGQRWGLAIAGFFAGYVSSTAAIAGFGQRVRETPALLRPATSAAMLANLASLTLFVPILLAVSPTLLPVLAAPLLAAAIVLAVGGLLGLRGSDPANTAAPTAKNRMFQPRHAVAFAALVAVVWLVVAALNAWLGPRGALVGAALSAAVELHAAVSTLGQLFNRRPGSGAGTAGLAGPAGGQRPGQVGDRLGQRRSGLRPACRDRPAADGGRGRCRGARRCPGGRGNGAGRRQMIRSVIALSTARVRSRVPSLSRISDT